MIRNSREPKSDRHVLATVFAIGGISLVIGFLALANPHIALSAALRGVAVWWDILFPALFPFFVMSELLLGFGIVHLAGTLLDPFMRPLFRLPGVGGFIVAMGFASGYPVGAKLTSRLMEQKLVTRDQGERLVAMTTTSDPIFLIGAVSIGFFGSLQAAPALAVAHYSGALLLGLVAGFRSRASGDLSLTPPKPPGGRLRAALQAMHRARIADGRPFGVMLQQSLQSSLTLIVIVGGLVVFFSAVLDLLLHSGLLLLFRDSMGELLRLIGLSPKLAPAFVSGTFEVTLGSKAAATVPGIPLVDRVAVAAFVLSWAGLSVHAQVAGLMSRTAWRYLPFARMRLAHGILAMAIVYAIWPYLGPSAITGSASIPPPGMNAMVPGSPHAVLLPASSFFSSAAWLPFTFLLTIAIIIAAGSVAAALAAIRRGR
ncbi:sporulation integral membrane protein YlbJ [Cohnella endophytica]|uniref:Sporulation integral membrane protein YlbJ n=2 Tax=Cohnella endophytica TaxID=2419778 RepID=A0A494Y0L3_9BACL|nr:sporulation integral membrane protein YlbJ [Cohnella endophytica]